MRTDHPRKHIISLWHLRHPAHAKTTSSLVLFLCQEAAPRPVLASSSLELKCLFKSRNIQDQIQFQVHDRDALPQPQFVAPVLVTEDSNAASLPVKGRGSKPPIKGGPAAKAKAASRPVSRGKPAALTDSASQAAIPPASEYVKRLLLHPDLRHTHSCLITCVPTILQQQICTCTQDCMHNYMLNNSSLLHGVKACTSEL